ncbi:hypothetical protein [Limnothrix redekei]|uniref:Uncharacterized protein n=1 Tax=Limnothrix redekei LRLZ20PSL1 TaxID=3112953 RepID=A0ABW7C845_9CYAN
MAGPRQWGDRVGCVGERLRGNGLVGLSPTHRRSPLGITSRFGRVNGGGA